MIVAFLLIYCYSAGAWKYVKKTLYHRMFGYQNSDDNDSFVEFKNWLFDLPPLNTAASLTEEQIRFFPPVYEQRYWTVAEILRRVATITNIRKVADVGCSEMAFFNHLKHMEGVEEIMFVDIDEDILERFACRTIPLTADYLERRETPLTVHVLCGDASLPDRKLEGTNVIIAIELIEHLYPRTLEDLPYAVFGIIQPDLVIFTTPNCEFNVVFPNFSGFRHDDHKFEWSREQFVDWGRNLTLRYPQYEVFFKGIGPGPEGTEQFGFCSQMAVFCRKATSLERMDTSKEFGADYKVIQENEFPLRTESRTGEEIIQDDAEHFIKYAVSREEYFVNDRIEIPLHQIMLHVPRSCTSEEMLRDILSKANWKIEKLPNNEYAVILPEYSDSSSTFSDCNVQEDYDPNLYHPSCNDVEECWDGTWETGAPDQNGEACAGAGGFSYDESVTWPVDKELEEKAHHFAVSNNCTVDQVMCQNGGREIERSNGVKHDIFLQSASSLKNEASSLIETKDCLSVPEITDKTFTFRDISENHKPFTSQPFVRCHSFEQINKRGLNKNKNFRYSLCDEDKLSACDTVGAKNVVFSSEKESSLEEILSGASCSDRVFLRLEDSCSQSKAGDSGYPNSSERDMEMDLTPEQVDEIVTESESSFEDGDDEESVHGDNNRGNPQRPPMQQVHWIDNMENGDVANNNRDWEGNNMEGEAQIGEALQFENLIDHQDFALPLMDAVPPEMDSDEENRYLSANDFFNSSDDTLVGSQDSINGPDRVLCAGANCSHYFDSSPASSLKVACGGIVSLPNTLADHNIVKRLQSGIESEMSIQFEEAQEVFINPVVPENVMDEPAAIPIQEFNFPPWLLQILVDENENGVEDEDNPFAGGDLREMGLDLNNGEEEENDQEEFQLIMTVEGDLMGGGEPAQENQEQFN